MSRQTKLFLQGKNYDRGAFEDEIIEVMLDRDIARDEIRQLRALLAKTQPYIRMVMDTAAEGSELKRECIRLLNIIGAERMRNDETS